jgi:hypothetical protein
LNGSSCRDLSLAQRELLDEDGQARGFAEATFRHDYVNDCNTSPAAFFDVSMSAKTRAAAGSVAR